jgi:dihydrolipoamide dehydrogenase
MTVTTTDRFDVVVIGGGPGGYVAAIRAAQLGGKVALVESRELGGTCLNRGCIPSKALIHVAQMLADLRDAPSVGIEVENVRFDLRKAVARKDRIVSQLVRGIEFLMGKNGITLLRGRGRLAAPDLVEVTDDAGAVTRAPARNVILATGSVPVVLPIPGADGDRIITSDQAVHHAELPESIAIVGGGSIGMEFAYIYTCLGAKTTVVEMMPQIVPTEDPEVVEVLHKCMAKAGTKIRTGAKCICIEDRDGKKVVTVETQNGREEIAVDLVLMAAGRRAATEGVGAEEVGLEMDRANIRADEHLRTSVPGVYAVGDCIRGIGLAHQASHEGIAAAENAMGGDSVRHDDLVPACLYTVPEIASVGLREHEAQARGIEVKVGRFPFRALGKSLAIGGREGFVKIVADAATGRLLGGQIIGPHATEIIQEVVVGLKMGATAEQIGETIHAHPTLPEAVGEAALDAVGRAIHI